MKFAGRTLVEGEGRGPLAVLEPLSLWGGLDSATGRVIERSHAAFGVSLAGTVLAMPVGRGSSSSSSVLAEAIRLGTAPAAIVLSEPDPILVIGALVASALYGRACPVVVLSPADHARLALAASATVAAGRDGASVITP